MIIRAHDSSPWKGYAVAVSAVIAALCLRYAIIAALGASPRLMILFVGAIIVSAWYGGLRPGLLASVLSTLLGLVLTAMQTTPLMGSLSNWVLMLCFLIVGVLISVLIDDLHNARARAQDQREALDVTLASIGEGVITTDTEGRVTRLNPVAEQLTGWSDLDARSRPLADVFHIVSEYDREPLDNPALTVLEQEGKAVRLSSALLRDKAGREHPIDANAALIRKGNVVAGVVLTFRDITGRVQAEAALRGREERFRALADSAPVLIWMSDENKAGVYFNKSWLDFVGKSLAQQVGDQWLEQVHPEDRDILVKACENAFALRKAFTCEFRLKRTDGTWRWMLDTGSPRFDEDDHFLGFIGSCIDVTEARLAKDRVSGSERRLRLLADSLPALIGYVDRNQVYRFANKQYKEWFGLESADVVGRHLRDVLGEDQYRRRKQFLDKVFAGKGSTSEARLEHPTLGVRDLDVTYSPDLNEQGQVQGFYVMGLDVTSRKQAEIKLRANQHRLQLAQEAGRVGVFEWLIKEERIVWSPELEALYGLENGEFQGGVEDWVDRVEPEDARQVLADIEQAMARRDPSISYEFRAVLPDGSRQWLAGKASFHYDSDGQPVRMIGVNVDIESRRQAEEAMRASEERYRAIVECQTEMVCRFTPEGDILFVNGAYARSQGATPEALVAQNFWDFIAEKDRASVQELLDGLTPESPEVRIENRFETADGTRWTLWANRALAFDENGQVTEVQSTGIDITDRKQMEEALSESRDELERRVARRTAELQQRADQLARLSSQLTLAEQRERRRLAQVLHDHLQQLLVAANMRVELLARTTPDQLPEASRQVRELIAEAIESSRTLTVELSPPILHEAGLAAGLEWAARWKKQKYGLNVELQIDPDAEPEREDVRVLVFESVRELLFNVVKHAQVDTARVEMAREGQDKLRVTVIDHGKGLREQQIVEESEGGATGFGLFSIRERITLLGGDFKVESSPGDGTRITLIAPIGGVATVRPSRRKSDRDSAVSLSLSSSNGTADNGHDRDGIRVLIADDHIVMREGLSALLAEEPGINVVGEASDGVEAVEMAGRLAPDVVLMDFSMPRMNGVEATRELRKLLPKVKVIGLSMYEEPDRSAAMIEAGASAYLTKSGSADVLLATITRVYHNGRGELTTSRR